MLPSPCQSSHRNREPPIVRRDPSVPLCPRLVGLSAILLNSVIAVIHQEAGIGKMQSIGLSAL
jgi:hypothetical protein